MPKFLKAVFKMMCNFVLPMAGCVILLHNPAIKPIEHLLLLDVSHATGSAGALEECF